MKAKSRSSTFWKSLPFYFFSLPDMLICTAFTVLPVLIAMVLSFTNFNVMETPTFAGITNYQRLFVSDPLFKKALTNTLTIAAITGPGGYILSFFFAWVLNEFHPKLRTILTLFLYAPSISGGAITIFTIIYSGDRLGWINSFLINMNLIYEPIAFLTDPKYMLGAAIVAMLWMSLGTSFLSFIAGFQSIDNKLYEAAAVDGIRNRWQELWYITLPAMRPQLFFGAVMSITGAFGSGALITSLFGNPSTNYTLYTLEMMLGDYGGSRFEMGYASAIAVVLFGMMIAANEIVQHLLSKVGE